jgi:hypothetical protein
MGLFSVKQKPGVTAFEAKKALAEIHTGEHKWTETQRAHAQERLMGYINADSPISAKGRMTASEVGEYMSGLKTDQHKLGLSDEQINKLGNSMNKYVKTNATAHEFFN